MRALRKRMTALGETEPMMRLLQLATIAHAKRLAHRRTGQLQRSIAPGPVTHDSAVIVAHTPYAAALEFGAKPHIIRPKRARVLAWGGARRLSGRLRSGAKPDHFAALVHHPGNKPYPFLVPGAQAAIKETGVDAIVKAWNEAA